MEKLIGRVVEVFIPREFKNNMLIDEMNSNKVGFKVDVDGEIIEIIQEQDENNANIYKDDIVLITKQNISGRDFIDIEKYEEEYE